MTDPGRKFTLTLVILIIFGGLTALDKMTVDGYSDFCLWVMGLYFGANVGQKFAPMLKKQV